MAPTNLNNAEILEICCEDNRGKSGIHIRIAGNKLCRRCHPFCTIPTGIAINILAVTVDTVATFCPYALGEIANACELVTWYAYPIQTAFPIRATIPTIIAAFAIRFVETLTWRTNRVDAFIINTEFTSRAVFLFFTFERYTYASYPSIAWATYTLLVDATFVITSTIACAYTIHALASFGVGYPTGAFFWNTCASAIDLSADIAIVAIRI